MFLTSAGPTSRHYQQQHNQRHLQFQFQQQGLSGAVYSRSIPDFNPSVFDFIQADDNETYILWSSSNPDAPGSGNGGSSTPVPSMSLPQTQQHQTNMPLSDPYGSTSTSTGAAKRWSAGESFVGKDKAKDVQLHETSSVPSSPTASRGSHSQPPNAFKAGGTGSTGGGGGGQSSRGNTGAFNTAGSGQQVLLPENRVLMAATVEKLVEKLTSDIDYTFLTDFFLIYRSFISPLALLKLLMARFRWALMEDSPQRQIVRVRTFVTLRHWLLNYFEFDFTGSRLLRRTLTRGLRDLTSHPIVLSSVRDKRIVEDLRKHFQKKRRAHCRGMAQMALERSQEAVQSDTGVAVRRSVRHPRTTNLGEFHGEYAAYGHDSHYLVTEVFCLNEIDWTDCRTSSKRSSLESGRIKSRRQTYFSGAKDDSMIEYNATGLSHVVTNNNEKAEEEDDDGSSSGDSSGLDSTDSQSEDDLYEEESHYLIHGGQQTPASNRRAPSGNDSGDDDVSENDSVDEDSMSGSLLARKQQQLPSPAFSSRSGGSNVGVLQDPYWYQQSPTGVMDYTQVSSHTTEIMEVQSHHRSNTVPRGGNMRSSNARPLSYTAMGSTSSVVLSPPESPRPLEPYINPPPPRNTLLSADKKKTWSQYMIATVEQLSKVKRVFMPRSSQSIHDLRRNASSTSSQSLVVGGKRGGRTGSSKSKKLEKSKGSMNSRYWQEDRIEKHGHKVSHSTTILDSMTGTNSVVSSADGQPAPSYEDVSVRHLEHTRSNGASEWSSDEDERTVDLMLRGIHPYSPGSRQVTEALFQPRRYAEESRSEYSKSLGKAAVEQAKYQKSQTIDDERDELNEESQTGGPTGASNLTPGRMPILRRTTQKRDKDHRASWMTFSSTGSSGFGAILSQGHIPPGQAIVRDRNELGNVDRFMERFYKSQQQQQQPQSYSSASPSPIDNRNNDTSDSLNNNCSSNIFSPVKGGRRKSMDAFHENQLRQASLSARGASISGQNLGQSNSRIGNNARSWMSRTLASHPHRQTVPIMNHNYLQEKLNEEMLEEYRPIRRHSSDVRNLEGWPTMMRTKEHKTFFGAHPLKGPRPPPVHNNNIHTHGNNHHHSTDTNHSIITDSHTQSNNNGSIFGSDYVRNQSQNRYHPLAPIPDPVQTCLLEGEAYKAALEESQRKGQALLQSSGARTVSQTHAHSFSSPLTFLLPDSMMGQDPTPGPGFDKSRSNSDPHLLQATAAMMSMSSPNGESDVYTYATRSSPQPGHSRIGGIGPLGGNYRSLSQQQQYTRHQSIVYPPYQYHSHHSHLDNSYSQQRSPMNPRFQSIISPTRDLMAPRPVPSSIVLRYRSEMIAQQMCLIEREQLFRVQWHELLKDGWKKKAPTTPTAEDGPLPTSDNSANSVSGHQPEPSSAGEPSYPVAGTTTVGDESPNVILLVDRFNLTCNWVTSEILKTTDLEMRVRVVEKFIRIAYTCYNHSNFSSLTQVMLGLQAHEVSRLSRTWARVGSHGMKIMQELVEFTTMLRNWKNLRDAMQDIIDQWGDTSSGSAAAVAIAATSTSAPASMGRTGLGGENQSITVATVPTTASATSVPTNRQSQLGLFSKKSSTVKDKSSKNGTAVHSKSVSGPVFPSLMSSLSKDKERERQQHILLQQQTQQQQHQLHHHPSLQYGLNTENNEKDKEGKKGIQQQHKGCIPVLAVYLSDLSFNNELPSFIEPKRPLSVSTSEYSSIQSPGPLSQSESMSTAVFLESTIAATVTPTPPASGHHPHPHHHQYNSSTTTASTMTTDITAGGASTTSGSTVSTPTASGYNIAASSVAVPHPPCSVPTSSAPAESLYPLMVHQGMVNMHKHRTIATIIKRILTFKAMANRYPFRKENEVFDWLMAIEAVDPSDWQRMSEICEEKQQPLQHQSQQQYQHQQPPQEQQQRQNQPSIISISTTIAASTVSTAAMTTVLPSSPPTSAASAPPMMMTAPIILPSAENNTRFA
ncbi:hypothetical protein BGZ83_011032 [Gryganskiella cystojenkinii]|nr:hypothetical protein BGZ83_011032 [Gryganskiella cystojenkinii]